MIRIASACLLAYWAVLFVLTHLPSQSLPRMQGSDKLHHLLAFAGLAFLLAWALPTRAGKSNPSVADKATHGTGSMRHVVLAAVIALVYACLDEFTQKFIPGRTCDVWDVVADAAGICLGLSGYVVLRAGLVRSRWGRTLIKSLSS